MIVADKYSWLEEYLLAKVGVAIDYKEEWDWKRFSLNGKMFAAFCAENSDNCLVTVKCEPSFNVQLRESYEDIIEGYYMNKIHWNSIKISGNVPDEVVRDMCDRSYNLILNSFSKKVKLEILSGK